MTVEQRIKLLDAGYTREEIESFSGDGADPAPGKVEGEKDPAPAEEKPSIPENDNPGETLESKVDALASFIKGYVAAQQREALNGTGYNGRSGLTAEVALAQGVFGNK